MKNFAKQIATLRDVSKIDQYLYSARANTYISTCNRAADRSLSRDQRNSTDRVATGIQVSNRHIGRNTPAVVDFACAGH